MQDLRTRDEGFTLVELLITIVIMGVSISVLVLAMSSLVVATQEHRGHAVSDSTARDFSEAMQQKVSWTTTLTADVDATGAVTLALRDPVSNFQTNTFPFNVLVDQEIMTVTAGSGSSLTVTSGNRGAAGSSSAAHSSGATISQDFICPTATFAANPANHSGYLYPDGFTQPINATASIGEIDYWNQTTNTFTAANATSTCLGNFSTGSVGCPDNNTFLPECDPGYFRVQVHVATSLQNLRNVTTDTWVLIRRGSN
jgi:prepilin-type N-terminal cleavage/methylation domain-containing protein